jgi:hypothetical protein
VAFFKAAPRQETGKPKATEVEDDQHQPVISRAEVQDMKAHRHDVEYHCELVLRMMQKSECLPYAFERAVTLLRKERRYEEEAIICRYVKDWAAQREAEYTTGTKTWLSPSIQRLIRRLPETESLWLENPHGER